ncbi:MAG: hypothetical protein R2759_19180 [Bacteroidales bacterium]
MEGIIRLYIENRMEEMGYSKFHFKINPVTVKSGESIKRIDAHNEFWYLFDVNQVDDNFTLTANNNIINQDEFVVDGVPYISYELTGDIIIDNTGAFNDQTFLFYRVIPN